MESPFELVDKDGFHAVRTKNSNVAVITYTLDENGLLDKIGVVTSSNPHFSDGSYKGLIVGNIEPADPSLLFRAKTEVQKYGVELSGEDDWDFLGELYLSKDLPDSVYCYSLDVTSLNIAKIKSDEYSFLLLSLNKTEKIPDSVLQSCFFKLFSKLYKQDLAGYGTT